MIADVVRVSVPLHALAPSKLSKTDDDIVTLVEPLAIFGASVTVPPAATIVVSGFRSHSEAGVLAILPLTTNKVAVYGGNVWVADHDCEDEATMVVGDDCDKVLVVTLVGVNPVVVNCTCAEFPGSLLSTMIVNAVPVEFSAA